VQLSGVLKRTSTKLTKICNDIRLLSSGPRCGLNEINLPQMQPGSSIMPGKVNPVIPEVVNQTSFLVIGLDLTVTLAASAGQLQLNVMEPVITYALFKSIFTMENAVNSLRTNCVDGITANAEHTRDMVLNSLGIITVLKPLARLQAMRRNRPRMPPDRQVAARRGGQGAPAADPGALGRSVLVREPDQSQVRELTSLDPFFRFRKRKFCIIHWRVSMAEQRKACLSWYFKSNLLSRIMIGLVAGAVVGIALGYGRSETVKAFVDNTKFFGDIFIRLLKMIVVPVILFSLIAGAASIAPSRSAASASRSSPSTWPPRPWPSPRPVLRQPLPAGRRHGHRRHAGVQGKAAEAPTLAQIPAQHHPDQPGRIAGQGRRAADHLLRHAVRPGHRLRQGFEGSGRRQGRGFAARLVNAAAETMYKIVRGIMQYAPIGVFFLIAMVFAQQGAKALGPLLIVTLTVYLGLLVHLTSSATAASGRLPAWASSSSSRAPTKR
jgi:hypothetical protein